MDYTGKYQVVQDPTSSIFVPYYVCLFVAEYNPSDQPMGFQAGNTDSTALSSPMEV